MDESKHNEGIFTGITVGALLGPFLMFCLWLISSSQPPIPTPVIAIQDQKRFGACERDQIATDDNPANHSAPSKTKASTVKPYRPNQYASNDHNDDPPTSRWTKADVIFAAFFSFCLVIVGILQWVSMQKQAAYMRNGLELTSIAANAAAKGASAADKTVEQMRLEQRAWISLGDPKLVGILVAGEPIRCTLLAHNSGTTPGTVIHRAISIDVVVKNADLSEMERKTIELARETAFQGVSAPNAPFICPAHSPFLLDEGRIIGIEQQPFVEIVMMAFFEYSLATGDKMGITQCCNIYDSQIKQFVAHNKYNRME